MNFLTVVIPTRNRPAFLQSALTSLLNQTDTDFSIVIADNSEDDSSERVVSQFDRKLKLTYFGTGGKLSMVENWNRGVRHSVGAHVAVMIDKTMWNPSAVSMLRTILSKSSDTDVVSWANESYFPDVGDHNAGLYVSHRNVRTLPREVSLMEALDQRRKFTKRRDQQDVHAYCLGKICFGVYSSRLIETITAAHGRLFHPLAPDYTSLTLASMYSRKSIQLGLPMQVSFQTVLSNGYRTRLNPKNNLDYIKTVDPDLESVKKLPLPGLYQSIENCVAYDLLQFDDLIELELQKPDLANLRQIVLSEIQNYGPEVDLSFTCEQTLEDVTRILNRQGASIRLRIKSYAFSSKISNFQRVVSNRVLLKLLSIHPRYRSVRCEVPQTALVAQDRFNLKWTQGVSGK